MPQADPQAAVLNEIFFVTTLFSCLSTSAYWIGWLKDCHASPIAVILKIILTNHACTAPSFERKITVKVYTIHSSLSSLSNKPPYPIPGVACVVDTQKQTHTNETLFLCYFVMLKLLTGTKIPLFKLSCARHNNLQ